MQVGLSWLPLPMMYPGWVGVEQIGRQSAARAPRLPAMRCALPRASSQRAQVGGQGAPSPEAGMGVLTQACPGRKLPAYPLQSSSLRLRTRARRPFLAAKPPRNPSRNNPRINHVPSGLIGGWGVQSCNGGAETPQPSRGQQAGTLAWVSLLPLVPTGRWACPGFPTLLTAPHSASPTLLLILERHTLLRPGHGAAAHGLPSSEATGVGLHGADSPGGAAMVLAACHASAVVHDHSSGGTLCRCDRAPPALSSYALARLHAGSVKPLLTGKDVLA